MTTVGEFCPCPICGWDKVDIRKDKKGRKYIRCPYCLSLTFLYSALANERLYAAQKKGTWV